MQKISMINFADRVSFSIVDSDRVGKFCFLVSNKDEKRKETNFYIERGF